MKSLTEQIAEVARKNGCSPFFWKPYKAYCCGCDDDLHCCDQQCSLITLKSAKRRRKK